MGGWVYMMTNRRDGTLYVGVASDLPRRAYQHRESLIDGFTKRYGLKMLVYYEQHDDIRTAIQRENDQTLAAGLEGATNSSHESGLERPVRYAVLIATLRHGRACPSHPRLSS